MKSVAVSVCTFVYVTPLSCSSHVVRSLRWMGCVAQRMTHRFPHRRTPHGRDGETPRIRHSLALRIGDGVVVDDATSVRTIAIAIKG